MKKLTITLSLVLFVVSFANAEKTNWLSVGYERSAYALTTDDLSPTSLAYGSNGLNIMGFTFKDDKNIGWYSSVSFRSTDTYVESDGSYTDSYDIEDVLDTAWMIDFKFGMGYQSNSNNPVQFYSGIGLHYWLAKFAFTDYYEGDRVSYDETDISLGLGGDLGVKINFNELVALMIGTGISLDFLGHADATFTYGYQSENISEWLDGYFGFGYSPKLALCFSF